MVFVTTTKEDPRRPISLPDISVSRADIASVRQQLWAYHARYAP